MHRKQIHSSCFLPLFLLRNSQVFQDRDLPNPRTDIFRTCFDYTCNLGIMIRMDERKLEQKKNRAENFRRLKMEAVFFLSVVIVYILFYLFFSSVLNGLNFFVSIRPSFLFIIRIVLFFISAGCTKVLVNSKGFNANLFRPKK